MALQAGDKAPQFTSKDQNGQTVRLVDLKGKKVVLYFYPRDQTPGCTAEACSLRDNYKRLLSAGYQVFGVSTDTEKSHQKFIEKVKLPFNLLADTDKVVHEQYGAWVEKSLYGRKYMGTARVTYLINEKGIIEEVINKVDTRNHADQILHTAAPEERKAVTKAKKTAKKSLPTKKLKKPAKKSKKR